MKLTQVGVAVGVFASVAAGAALVRWPYNLLAEVIIDVTALLTAVTIAAWLISLFYERISSPFQHITLLAAGSLLGAYLTITAGYFSGYIGYNYPASQQRIFQQTQEINSLTESLAATRFDLASTATQLADAKKSMENPRSIEKPSYNLDTSVKLQFDNAGNVQEVESHNVKWEVTTVPEATETAYRATGKTAPAAT